MRLGALVAGMLMLFAMSVMLLARAGQNGAQIVHQANARAMSTAIVTAAAALDSDVVNSISNLDVSTAGTAFSGSVACGLETCTWTAQRATETATGESSTVVVNGGGTRTIPNQNTALDDSNHDVGNDLLYRLTLSTPESMALPLDVTIQVLDSNPIEAQVPSIRLDRAALTGGSVSYADQLCGQASLNCADLTSGADTTVIMAQKACFEQTYGASDVQSACTPVGGSTASPEPVNQYNTKTNSDGSISP